MTDIAPNIRTAQQVRIRALVVPREHGAWGLLLVPIFTGAVVGVASSHKLGPVVLFTLAALALFWLRTPVESLLGTTPMKAQTAQERRGVLMVSLGLAGLTTGCLAALLWSGQNSSLLLLGGIAALLFVVRTLLMKLGRRMRMTAQMVGALGLTSTAAAAYYVSAGHLDKPALVLWGANWVFAGNQIHFVQLRIHAARAATFAEKFARGRVFFLGQIALLPVLAAALHWRLMPRLVMLAFLPGLVRGFYWFFRGHQSLQVKTLGWSEMRQGILFGILLAAALILSLGCHLPSPDSN